jgi:hypothetical protein
LRIDYKIVKFDQCLNKFEAVVRVLEFLSKKLKENYGSDAKAVIVDDILGS